jgi:hypothetical protein
MGLGLRARSEAGDRLYRQNLPGRLRYPHRLCGRRRQRRHQHQATGAARVGTGLAIVLAAGRCRICRYLDMAGDGGGRVEGRRNCPPGTEACNDARKSDRVSGCQRKNAPSHSPLGKILVHQQKSGPASPAKTKNILPANKFRRQLGDYRPTVPLQVERCRPRRTACLDCGHHGQRCRIRC